MGKKPGVILYFDIRPALKRLSDEEKGQLFEAILDYGENGVVPRFDGCLGIAWDFIQPRIDADSQRYQRTAEARRAAANARWGKEKVQNDTKASFALQTMPTTTSSTSTKRSERHADMACSADTVKKPARKKYGQYGWVKLNDEEYNRLLDELGETELKRCIAYVDESAQSSGNRNHWKDWSLVIRRCYRGHWGLRQSGKFETGYSSDWKDFQPSTGFRGNTG